MRQKNSPMHEDDPKVTSRLISRPEGFSLDDALDALKKGNKNTAVNGFLYLAAGINSEKEARIMRDRVIALLNSREVTRKEWAQEIIAVLNDALDQVRAKTKAAAGGSVTPIKKESKTLSRRKSDSISEAQDVPSAITLSVIDAVPGRGTRSADVVVVYGENKKEERIVRVIASDASSLTEGAAYLRHGHMPSNLKDALIIHEDAVAEAHYEKELEAFRREQEEEQEEARHRAA
jgi:hypothetical protein